MQVVLRQAIPTAQITAVWPGLIAQSWLADLHPPQLPQVLLFWADLPDVDSWLWWQHLSTNYPRTAGVVVVPTGRETAVSRFLSVGVANYLVCDPQHQYLPLLAPLVWQAHHHQQQIRPLPVSTASSRTDALLQVVNLTSDAIVITDETMRIIFFNEEALRTFGYDPAEIIGQPLSLLLPERYHRSHERHIEAFKGAVETMRGMEQRPFVMARNRHGREFWAEVTVIKLQRAGVIHFAAILRDMSHRLRPAETPHQYARRLEALHEMDHAILTSYSPQETANAVLSYLGHLLVFRWASIIAVNPATGQPDTLAVTDTNGAGHALEPFTLSPNFLWQQAVQSHVQDLPLISLPLAEIEQVHVLVLPLAAFGQLAGALCLCTPDDRPLEGENLALLREVSRPVAVAIQLTNLLQTERQQRHLAETLRQSAATLNSTLDLDHVLRMILEQLARVVNYDSATIMLLQADALQVVARQGALSGLLISQLAYESLTHIREVLEEAHPVLIADTAVASNWQIEPGAENIRCWLGVPLIVKNLVIGLLNLNKQQPGFYTHRDTELTLTFANQAAIAVENAQLYTRAMHEIGERRQAEQALQAERALLARHVEERTAELTAANAQLARAVRSRDDFLASMSHELRTPLNAVLGLADVLQSAIYGPLNEEQRRLLHTIISSGRHLLELINDILDLARIEAGQLELDIYPVPVLALCDSCLTLVRPFANYKSVKLELHINPNVTTIQADELRVQQILVNLLNNAIKFTSMNGHVGLTVRQDDTRPTLYFTVWDTGIGLSPDDLRQLFSGPNGPAPFVQLDAGLTRHYEGTGLGLVLIYRLTEMHGGSLTIRSEVGQGSRFTVALPMHRLDAALSDLVPTPPDTAVTPFPPTILLAEDNRQYIRSLSAYLSAQGYRLLLAHNGREAVRLARQTPPDLIIMDLQMPELDGLEALRLIHEEVGLSDVPIVTLTSLITPGDQKRLQGFGILASLSKPIHLPELGQTIQKLLPHLHGDVTSGPG